jgi:hypothetical protein
VGPRAVLDAVAKRKIPSPRWESNYRTPIVQLVAQRYTDWAITATKTHKVFLFNSAQFSLITDNPKQPILEKKMYSLLTLISHTKNPNFYKPSAK